MLKKNFHRPKLTLNNLKQPLGIDNPVKIRKQSENVVQSSENFKSTLQRPKLSSLSLLGKWNPVKRMLRPSQQKHNRPRRTTSIKNLNFSEKQIKQRGQYLTGSIQQIKTQLKQWSQQESKEKWILLPVTHLFQLFDKGNILKQAEKRVQSQQKFEKRNGKIFTNWKNECNGQKEEKNNKMGYFSEEIVLSPDENMQILRKCKKQEAEFIELINPFNFSLIQKMQFELPAHFHKIKESKLDQMRKASFDEELSGNIELFLSHIEYLFATASAEYLHQITSLKKTIMDLFLNISDWPKALLRRQRVVDSVSKDIRKQHEIISSIINADIENERVQQNQTRRSIELKVNYQQIYEKIIGILQYL